MERWRLVQRNTRYKISNLGRLFDRNKNEIVIGYTDPDGYHCIYLRRGQSNKVHRVHQLVLEAFVGRCPIEQEPRHLNGKPWDNRLTNLKYGTRKQNHQDAMKHGTHQSLHQDGVNNPMSKLTNEQVRYIRKVYKPWLVTQQQLANELEVTQQTISSIVNQKSYIGV